jgi:hypothetical protein
MKIKLLAACIGAIVAGTAIAAKAPKSPHTLRGSVAATPWTPSNFPTSTRAIRPLRRAQLPARLSDLSWFMEITRK